MNVATVAVFCGTLGGCLYNSDGLLSQAVCLAVYLSVESFRVEVELSTIYTTSLCICFLPFSAILNQLYVTQSESPQLELFCANLKHSYDLLHSQSVRQSLKNMSGHNCSCHKPGRLAALRAVAWLPDIIFAYAQRKLKQPKEMNTSKALAHAHSRWLCRGPLATLPRCDCHPLAVAAAGRTFSIKQAAAACASRAAQRQLKCNAKLKTSNQIRSGGWRKQKSRQGRAGAGAQPTPSVYILQS